MEKESIFTNKYFWEAVATLVGTIIGAGILGIPYVVAKVGLWLGILITVLLGLASMLLNLMIAEMMLRTRFRHQVSGLAKKYLGKTWKHVTTLGLVLGSYGGLTAYIIGEGHVLAVLFGQAEKVFLFSIIFFIIGVLVLLVGLKLIKVLEIWLVLFIGVVILLISGIGIPFINVGNFNFTDWKFGFVAYGVLLFAFGGIGSIFSVKEILRSKKKMVKPAIIIGSLIPIIIYLLFAVVVVGVCGKETTEIATIGLGSAIGPQMLLLGNLFAALAMATSFFTIGLGLKQVYHYDYKLQEWLSWLLVAIVPLIIFLFVSNDFIEVIGTAGSIAFGLVGILIVLSFWKAKKFGDQKPVFNLPKFKLLGGILAVIFVLGIVYTFVDLLG